MPWAKINRSSKRYIWIFVFIGFFILTRVPRLHNDVVNPDSVNWHVRSEQFVQGLKNNQLSKTYQHYQPGVTLMWIIGPTVELIKQFNPEFIGYNEIAFPTFHFYSKMVLIFVQLVLTFVAFYALEKLIGWKRAFFTVALFTFEPFFVGNSRVLHLDVLLTLFLFNGLLFSYWGLKEFKWWKAILGGIFMGLAFLTKSIGLGGILFVSGVGGAYLWWGRGAKNALKYIAATFFPAILTIFLLLPALWVDFSFVVSQIYDGIERVGIRKGHNQIFFGTYTRDGGALFYVVTLLLQLSPFLLTGIILLLLNKKENFLDKIKKLLKINKNEMSLNLWLTIFYVGYFVVMTIGSKKIDRYMLPLYPALSFAAILGFCRLQNIFKRGTAKIALIVLFSFSIIYPLFKNFPYYFTYTNPMLGTPDFVHKYIIAQKPFGMAVFELMDRIHNDFGYQEGIAFLDPKPFFYLHPMEKAKFVDVDGTSSYRVLVVGVNEEFPTRVYESQWVYDYYDSIYVNGLEYWKIYVRGAEK